MSQFISLPEAVEMTSRYRTYREQILKPDYQNQNILAISEQFDRGEIDIVLQKEGCEGLRIYFGMDAELRVHSIIVGTDEEGNDMITTNENNANTINTETDDNEIIERGNRCPDLCPTDSPLNDVTP